MALQASGELIDTAEMTSPSLSIRVIFPVHQEAEVKAPFYHALKFALCARGELEIVDVRSRNLMSQRINVRQALEQWGLLPPGSSRDDVEKLGMHVSKVVTHGMDKKMLAERFERRPHDFIVLGTNGRSGRIQNLFGKNLIEFLSHHFRETTLFVPSGSRPFVSEKTGELSLRTILIPVADDPPCGPCFKMLKKLQTIFPGLDPEVFGLHTGDFFPHVSAQQLDGLHYHELPIVHGNPVQTISDKSREVNADLIIMATRGRATLSKKIVGSITEQVLRVAHCPVLAVPAE